MAGVVLLRDGTGTDPSGGYEWSFECEGDIVTFADQSWDTEDEQDNVHARWSIEMFRECIERFLAYGRALLIERGRLDCLTGGSVRDHAPLPPESPEEILSCLEVTRDGHGIAFRVLGWNGWASHTIDFRDGRRDEYVSNRRGWTSRHMPELPASFLTGLNVRSDAGARSAFEEHRAVAIRAFAARSFETRTLQETDVVVVTSPRDPAESVHRHAVRFLLLRPDVREFAPPPRAVFAELSMSCACFGNAIVDDYDYSDHECSEWERAIGMVRDVLESKRAWSAVSRLHLFVPKPGVPGCWLPDMKYASGTAFNARRT